MNDKFGSEESRPISATSSAMISVFVEAQPFIHTTGHRALISHFHLVMQHGCQAPACTCNLKYPAELGISNHNSLRMVLPVMLQHQEWFMLKARIGASAEYHDISTCINIPQRRFVVLLLQPNCVDRQAICEDRSTEAEFRAACRSAGLTTRVGGSQRPTMTRCGAGHPWVTACLRSPAQVGTGSSLLAEKVRHAPHGKNNTLRRAHMDCHRPTPHATAVADMTCGTDSI